MVHIKTAGEDKHVEMEADYTPAADMLTPCRNSSNVRANAWVDDLTGRFQRALKLNECVTFNNFVTSYSPSPLCSSEERTITCEINLTKKSQTTLQANMKIK